MPAPPPSLSIPLSSAAGLATAELQAVTGLKKTKGPNSASKAHESDIDLDQEGKDHKEQDYISPTAGLAEEAAPREEGQAPAPPSTTDGEGTQQPVEPLQNLLTQDLPAQSTELTRPLNYNNNNIVIESSLNQKIPSSSSDRKEINLALGGGSSNRMMERLTLQESNPMGANPEQAVQPAEAKNEPESRAPPTNSILLARAEQPNLPALSMASHTKTSRKPPVVLSEWSFGIAPNTPKVTNVSKIQSAEWIVLVGRRPDTAELWHSSIVASRITPSHIETGSGSAYVLKEGSMDSHRMAEHGFGEAFIAKFVRGFPDNWQQLIIDELLRMANARLPRRPVAVPDKPARGNATFSGPPSWAPSANVNTNSQQQQQQQQSQEATAASAKGFNMAARQAPPAPAPQKDTPPTQPHSRDTPEARRSSMTAPPTSKAPRLETPEQGAQTVESVTKTAGTQTAPPATTNPVNLARSKMAEGLSPKALKPTKAGAGTADPAPAQSGSTPKTAKLKAQREVTDEQQDTTPQKKRGRPRKDSSAPTQQRENGATRS